MSLFINSKKKLEFTNSEEGNYIIPRGYIGSVPLWVTETWLFKAACKDSTITFVGEAKSQIVVDDDNTDNDNMDNDNTDDDADELTALQEKAKALGIKNYKSMKAATVKARIKEAEAALNDDNNEQNKDDSEQDPADDSEQSSDGQENPTLEA